MCLKCASVTDYRRVQETSILSQTTDAFNKPRFCKKQHKGLPLVGHRFLGPRQLRVTPKHPVQRSRTKCNRPSETAPARTPCSRKSTKHLASLELRSVITRQTNTGGESPTSPNFPHSRGKPSPALRFPSAPKRSARCAQHNPPRGMAYMI